MPSKIRKRGENTYELAVTNGYDYYGRQIAYRKTVKASNMKEAQKLYYEFEIDYIYKINFMYKDKFYSLCYIYNQPTFYYSSLNHIKKALTGKGLDFIGDDFDLKLKIWQ